MASNVIAQFVSADGEPAGPQLDLPHDVTPAQLETLLNTLQNNEEKMPYAFYIEELELAGELGDLLQKNKISVESSLKIVYQPQALFRVRAVTRCTASMPGHSEAVLNVAFSPDGKALASGSGDTTVRLWDLNTQLPSFTCKGHTNWVLCVAWSPDGVHLVSGSMDGTLRLWDPSSGEAAGGPLKGHKKWVTSISWEPAHLALPSRRFVTSSKDCTVKIWDATTRRCVISLASHTKAVTQVKWGGDGLIYSASQDTNIYAWDSKEGKMVRQFKGHAHWVNTLALSTEHALRTGAYDHHGKCPKDVDAAKEQALERYNEARGGKPERMVSGSDDFTMFLWDPLNDKKPTTRMTGHVQLINQVRFSPDGRWIASASFDKSVKIWDGFTGKFIASLRGHVGPVYQVAWSSDSRMLVSGSKDSTLKVWEMRTRKCKEDLPGHADEVYAVDWSPDGTRVASGGKDRVLRLWSH